VSKRRGPSDPDHHAARIACRKPDHSWGVEQDLRAKLAAALQSGWSIRALKTYAYWWRYTKPQRDHVTRAAWRTAVSLSFDRGGRDFLEQYNADPGHYDAFVK
jgi:hypothetical protein